LKRSNCGFEADRDNIAILNIEKKVLSKIEESLTIQTTSQMTDVATSRCEELMNCPEGHHCPLGQRGIRSA